MPTEELMEKVPGYAENWQRGDEPGEAAARRAFERDKDELRRLGIPLRTVRYSIEGAETEGYEITRRDFYLPYLKLVAAGRKQSDKYPARHRVAEVEIREQDAPLALEALRRIADVPAFPLREEARSAFRKLAFDLDPSVFARQPSVLFVDQADARELANRLRMLTSALFTRKLLRFRYRGIYRDEETEREVAAYGLLFQRGQWYVVGHDATRQSLRIFRVDRMSDLVVNARSPNKPDYEVPPDFRLRDYTGRQAWELGDEDEPTVVAHVSFRFPQSAWAERNRYGRLLETRADGSAVRVFDVFQVNPFVRWILSQEGDAEIISPTELRDHLRSLARAIENAHGEDADAGE